jgi:hypothetical protein
MFGIKLVGVVALVTETTGGAWGVPPIVVPMLGVLLG